MCSRESAHPSTDGPLIYYVPPKQPPNLGGLSNVFAPGRGRRAGLERGDCSLLLDTRAAGSGLSYVGSPAQMSHMVAPGPKSRCSATDADLRRAFPNPAESSEGTVSTLRYRYHKPAAVHGGKAHTAFIEKMSVREAAARPYVGSQTAAAGHTHSYQLLSASLAPRGAVGQRGRSKAGGTRDMLGSHPAQLCSHQATAGLRTLWRQERLERSSSYPPPDSGELSGSFVPLLLQHSSVGNGVGGLKLPGC